MARTEVARGRIRTAGSAALARAVHVLALAALPIGASAVAAPRPAEWDFVALLGGERIGAHRYVVTPSGEHSFTVASEARFDVKILGIPVYRYRHRAVEHWDGDCLQAIDSRTDDDGRLEQVRGRLDGQRFVLDARSDGGTAAPAAGAGVDVAGCVMSFAYWNPALAARDRLLDPATGKLVPVTFATLPSLTIDVRGLPTPVRGVRISGLAQPIDVWYADDRWVGLDTTVEGGHRLSYRLR
jgi:hypothetical protein